MEIQSRSSLIISGLEGVLAPQMGSSAQPCDLESARLFCMLGGKLAVYTHRAPAAVRAALGKGTVSLPAVTCGGALIYDLNKDCLVQMRPITIQAGREILQYVRDQLPHAGVVGVDDHARTCLLRANREAQLLLNSEGGEYELLPVEAASPSWCKLSVCAPPYQLAQFKSFLLSRPDLPITIIRQDLIALELVTAQVQPRETMRYLCNLANCMQQDTTAVIAQPQDMTWAPYAGKILTMSDAQESLRACGSGELGYYHKGAMGEYLYHMAAQMQKDL